MMPSEQINLLILDQCDDLEMVARRDIDPEHAALVAHRLRLLVAADTARRYNAGSAHPSTLPPKRPQ